MLSHNVCSLVESILPLLFTSVGFSHPHLMVRSHLQTDLIGFHFIHIAFVIILKRLERMFVHNVSFLKRSYLVLKRNLVDWLPSRRRQNIMVISHTVGLVDNHVLQTLIEGRTHEDLGLHHLTSLTVVEDLVSVGVHAQFQHLCTQLLNLQV